MAHTVSNQWSRMRVVSLCIIPECVRLVARRHIHGALGCALSTQRRRTAKSAPLPARSGGDSRTSHGRHTLLAADGSRA
eukprot:5835586-Prymnesium_polylepis.1